MFNCKVGHVCKLPHLTNRPKFLSISKGLKNKARRIFCTVGRHHLKTQCRNKRALVRSHMGDWKGVVLQCHISVYL